MILKDDRQRGDRLEGVSTLARVAAISSVLAVAIMDLLLPADYGVPALYGVPLSLAAMTKSSRFLWGLSLVAIALTFGRVWMTHPIGDAFVNIVMANRIFVSLGLLLITTLGHVWVAARRRFEMQTSSLLDRNTDLDSLNQELGQREEEIVRQNEELQSQTEELERQGEELRVTNDELVAWQKILEQLLELSRAMKPELGVDEVFKKVCEALSLLTNGFPASVLERKGDDLVVRCHHGFGSEGPVSSILQFKDSFAALITSLGQTGYLEDVTLRPELRFPVPKGGAAPRSVLSTPLRRHGSCTGVIELYAPSPQSWSEMQVAMIESLAAQAEACIQTAEILEALRQERRRFEAAFYTVPFGVAVADDPEGREIRVNPAAAAMFNLPVNENLAASTPLGSRLRRSIYRGDRQLGEEEMPLLRALRGEDVQGEEVDVLLPGGKRISLLVSASPFFDSAGHIAGAVAGFIDITAVKLLQRELEMRRREAEEASVRKTRFLAAVSHDIRTPANAINLMAEVIRRTAENPAMRSQIPELANKLQANTRSMMELVSDLLDVARFDSGKMELLESEFSLDDLIAEECRQLLPLAQDKGLRIVVQPPGPPIFLRTDRVKLGRVLGNIIGNAIKFTESGEVQVSATLAQDSERRVVLRVMDTGIGIPPEVLPHIFDEFTQLRNPERDRQKGSGLGLAISKRLVELLGGVIEVESSVGRGTEFRLSLPASVVVFRIDLAVASSQTLPGSSSANMPPLRLRVLLVEDHDTTREGTKKLLAEEGVTVIEAIGAKQALSIMETEQIDVLLLDMMLPDMDGREVLRVISNGPRKLKGILVLTGDLTSERLEEIKRLGADGVIEKPVDLKKLVQALRSYAGAFGI